MERMQVSSTWRGRLLVLITTVAVAACALLVAGRIRRTWLDYVEDEHAMELVGSAGVRFLCETGANPTSLNELIAAGLLRVEIGDDICWVRGAGYPPIMMRSVQRVRLSFPELRDAALYEHSDPVLVGCLSVPESMQREANATLLDDWRRCVERARSESAASSPTSEP
jgi:hypothetical protein